MQLLIAELKKHKKMLWGALILATINQVFSLLDPQIFRMIVDNYATKAGELSSHDFIRGVGLLLLAVVLVAFISRVAKAFQDYYVNVIVQRVGTSLYAQSVAHAFSLPYAVFEDERSGEVLSKLQKARTDTQTLITNAINIVFLSLVGTLFVLIYATIVHPLIGLVYFLIIPTLGTAIFILSKKIKAAQQTIVRETASLAGSTTETLRNVELVKSLGLEAQEVLRLNTVNEQILALELQKVKMVRKLDFIQGTLINALRSGLMFLMLWFILQGGISLGEFFTLLFYSFFVFGPLGQLGAVATNYQEAHASLKELAQVLDMPATPVPEHPQHISRITNIAYKRVSLAYHADDKQVLHDVSLTIKSGETIAFVGPSGSGKSTMIKLLAGLYTATQGSVEINDINMTDLAVDEMRQKIGLVAQETQLFAGTIRENLLFVKPTATDEECMKALERAQASSILQRDGAGLDTKIGEGGLKLSGGERQRIAIARAILRDPDVIVFDEATSSLDSLTEKAITDTIKQIRVENEHIIKILVAHRLSTIVHADRIYVFEKGAIVETGTHQELVAHNGLYSALWREQIATA